MPGAAWLCAGRERCGPAKGRSGRGVLRERSAGASSHKMHECVACRPIQLERGIQQLQRALRLQPHGVKQVNAEGRGGVQQRR